MLFPDIVSMHSYISMNHLANHVIVGLMVQPQLTGYTLLSPRHSKYAFIHFHESHSKPCHCRANGSAAADGIFMRVETLFVCLENVDWSNTTNIFSEVRITRQLRLNLESYNLLLGLRDSYIYLAGTSGQLNIIGRPEAANIKFY